MFKNKIDYAVSIILQSIGKIFNNNYNMLRMHRCIFVHKNATIITLVFFSLLILTILPNSIYGMFSRSLKIRPMKVPTTRPTMLQRVEITFTKDTTNQTFTGYVSQGYDSEKHAFTVTSDVVKIEVYLYMPSGTDFDLSVWDPEGRRTGGWTSTESYVATDIPNSQYSGYSADPEWVVVDPVASTGTWYVGCYAYSGSGNYEIKVILYLSTSEQSETVPEPPTTFTGSVSGDGTWGPHYNNPDSVAWAEHKVLLTAGTEYSVTLNWDSSSDLDLYVYKPGTAPSQDGDGSDYVTRAYTTNKPETLTFTADVDGEWVLAVDHYSYSGSASYTLSIDIVGGEEQPSQQYQWVFAVYLDADNNLDSYGVGDLDEMKQVGSTDDVAIVVLMDRSSSGAYVYYVESGSVTVLESLGEVNMGDPNTLKYFVDYILNNFAATYYALILWNHGGGWVGCCWDDTDNDHLTLDEIQQALDGVHLSLIGFDACLMAGIEAAYELRNYADVMVASEETEPGDGWPYDSILSALTQNPTMTPQELAKTIVEKYIDFYGTSGSQTLSAIDLTKVGDVASALSQLAYLLKDKMSSSSSSQTFTGYVSQGYDSEKHAFTVTSDVIKLEVYLYMPSGTDFDLSIWDPEGRRTGGWTSTEHYVSTDIPNSQYSGYSADPEWVVVDPVASTGTWYAGCYAYSGSGDYEIKVILYYEGGYKNEIDNVLANVEYFSSADAADIYHFAYLVQQYISDSDIQSAAQAVMDAIVAAIIYELHGSEHPNAHGLHVYTPKTSDDYSSAYITSGLDFVADTYWDEFLQAYLGV